MTVHTLNVGDVGEPLVVKKGIVASEHLFYAGMPTDSCFSLAVKCRSGKNLAAYNLFFPVTQQQVELSGRRFAVNEVSPEQIQLEETA